MSRNDTSNKEVDILISDDVSGVYNKQTAELGSGTLGSSCMNRESYNSTSEYLSFYNGTARIAYTLNGDGHLQSRALIWDVVIEEDGETIECTMMDRIYGTEATQDAYKRYAQNKNWWHKKDQSHSSDSIVDKDGDQRSYFRTAKMVDGDSDEAPSVDTLKFYTEEGFLVSQHNYKGYVITDELTRLETGGECQNCGEPTDEDDSIWVDRCDEQGCTECTVWLGIEEESEFRDNANEVLVNGDYNYVSEDFCASDFDLAYVPDRDEYFDLGDVAWVEDEEEYVHNDDVLYCQHNDTYVRVDDSVELHDGDIASKYDDDVIEISDGVYALKSDCDYDKEKDEYTLN